MEANLAKEPIELAQVAAMGVAGWALAIDMLLRLNRLGIIGDEEGAALIDAALAYVEGIDGEATHRSFRMARTLLQGQLEGWNRARST